MRLTASEEAPIPAAPVPAEPKTPADLEKRVDDLELNAEQLDYWSGTLRWQDGEDRLIKASRDDYKMQSEALDIIGTGEDFCKRTAAIIGQGQDGQDGQVEGAVEKYMSRIKKLALMPQRNQHQIDEYNEKFAELRDDIDRDIASVQAEVNAAIVIHNSIR